MILFKVGIFLWHLRHWVMAYGPARWKIRRSGLAKQTSLTPAQVLLAWGIQRGTAVLTTAKTLERARENYNSRRFPKLPLTRSAGFKPGAGSTRWWRPGFRVSSRKAGEIHSFGARLCAERQPQHVHAAVAGLRHSRAPKLRHCQSGSLGQWTG